MYAIRNSGYSLHHTDRLRNNAGKMCFEFDVGDEISVDYNVVENLLSFTKNKVESLYEMNVHIAPPDDCYRPYVALWKIGDSISLVEPDKRLC